MKEKLRELFLNKTSISFKKIYSENRPEIDLLFLFIVDRTESFKDFIVEELETKSHVSNYKEFVIHIKSE